MGYEYVRVEGRVANEGIATYANNSSQYIEGGYYVNWNKEGGFSGKGWWPEGSVEFAGQTFTITGEMSPANGYTENYIEDMIDNKNNLNSIFQEWPVKVNDDDRHLWVEFMRDSDCAVPVSV